MSRVMLGLFVAAAASVAASSAFAGCCGNCCNTGFATGFAVVQPAPQVVAVQPPPVLVQVQQPPVLVPVVQQYVVNQGPVFAGPMLTDYNPAVYYAPRPVGAFPYVGGRRWYGHHRAGWGRPAWRGRAYHHHRHHHGPVRRYY